MRAIAFFRRHAFHFGALLALTVVAGTARAAAATDAGTWHFLVAGDSRNCGDIVMPAIAAEAHAHQAAFYWHLGDLRAIYGFDEDYAALHPSPSIAAYLAGAWPDFQQSQIEPFGDTPFIVGIGNHETIAPKTRDEFLLSFADWLDQPRLREQRLRDDPHDHHLRAYFHWIERGIDFIYLDNATEEQFDRGQLEWLGRVLARARANPEVHALVVGMHLALPDSLARGHSMSDLPQWEASGRAVYAALLDLNRVKPVQVLASHSHFVMEGIFNTAYWREHGGVLPGWIVGTAGAFRYPLPAEASEATFARTHVYGYLLGTVAPAAGGLAVRFEFHEVTEAMVPEATVKRFGADLVARCFSGNAADAAH